MSKTNNLDNEQELINACIRKEANAQKQLFELYAGKMLGVCVRYCQNHEDAKDALHEGYIKIFNQLDRFKGTAKLETWMTRIMINTSIDHFKKSIKYKGFTESEELKLSEDESYSIEYDDKDEVSVKQIYSVINKLPDGYRHIFNLYAIEGFTHKEIASQLDINEGTSKSQLARARKLLKKLLKEDLNIG